MAYHCCPETLSSYMHKHTLTLVDFTGCRSGRVCDVCNQRVNELVYQCRGCGFDVHPRCMLLPRQLKHSLHPDHRLVLQPSTTKSCAVCRGVCTHWRYSCKSCVFHIHPECALKNTSYSNSNMNFRAAATLTPQQVQVEVPQGYASVMSAPNTKIGAAATLSPQRVQTEVPRGYASVMSAPQVNPKGHQITCPTSATLSSYMHKHTLTLVDYMGGRSGLVCDVCSQRINDLGYRCRDCGFDVHPHCTLFPKKLKYALHPNHQLVLQPSTTKSCAYCRGACTHWRYCCKSCDFHIHPKCVLQSSSNLNTNIHAAVTQPTVVTPQRAQQDVPRGYDASVVTPQNFSNHFAPNMQYEFTNDYNMPYYYNHNNIYGNNQVQGRQSMDGNSSSGKNMYGIVQDLAVGVLSNVIFGALNMNFS